MCRGIIEAFTYFVLKGIILVKKSTDTSMTVEANVKKMGNLSVCTPACHIFEGRLPGWGAKNLQKGFWGYAAPGNRSKAVYYAKRCRYV